VLTISVNMVMTLASLRHNVSGQLALPGMTYTTREVNKGLFTPAGQAGVPEDRVLSVVERSEYATVYSEFAKRRTIHGVLIRNRYNDNCEHIFVTTLLAQGVNGTILEQWDLVFVTEDPEASQSRESRECRRFG
jgi:hypothetical protein